MTSLLCVPGQALAQEEQPTQPETPSQVAEPSEPADMPAAVRLLLPACAQDLVEQEQVVEALIVELIEDEVTVGGSGSEGTPPESTAVIVVDAPSCERAFLVVTLRRESGEAAPPETVDLTDRPFPDRARLLALALAELIRSSWPALSRREPPPEPATGDEEPPPPATPAPCVPSPCPPAVRPPPPPPRPSRFFGELMLDGRLYPSFQGMGVGGRLALWLRLVSGVPLLLGLDGGYRYGEASNDQGEVTSHHAFGALVVIVEGGSPTIRGHAGLRLELGRAWLIGAPADPKEWGGGRLDGFVLTPTLTVGARIALGRGMWVVAAFEVGYVAYGLEPMNNEDQRLKGGLGGMVAGLSLGVAYWPRSR